MAAGPKSLVVGDVKKSCNSGEIHDRASYVRHYDLDNQNTPIPAPLFSMLISAAVVQCGKMIYGIAVQRIVVRWTSAHCFACGTRRGTGERPIHICIRLGNVTVCNKGHEKHKLPMNSYTLHQDEIQDVYHLEHFFPSSFPT